MVYNCEANDAMYDESFTRVKHLLTNRLHGKVANTVRCKKKLTFCDCNYVFVTK